MKTEIFEMYEREQMGQNAICLKCRSETNVITCAHTLYLVRHAEWQGNSTFFIGKLARGDSFGTLLTENLEDVTNFGEHHIRNDSVAFFRYTREIMTRFYGALDEAMRRCSFGNIAKCNHDENLDTTDFAAKQYCIQKNRFIWKEVGLLMPRSVIFHTHRGYDDFIDEYRPIGCASFDESEDIDVDIGEKTMPWWERYFFDSNGCQILRFLRIGHPSPMYKEDFVGHVVEWLNSPNRSRSLEF